MYECLFDSGSYSDEELNVLAKLLHFDSASYLETNPDVRASGVAAFSHFLDCGVYEGRRVWRADDVRVMRPTPTAAMLGFDTDFYGRHYPDVVSHQFEHFLSCGMAERRLPYDFHENISIERKVWEILEEHEVDVIGSFDRQLTFTPEHVDTLLADLWAAVEDEDFSTKPYRNNFWLVLAACYLAKGFLGASSVCYNFFYNYFLPMPMLRNGLADIYVAAKCSKTVDFAQQRGLKVRPLKAKKERKVAPPVFLNRLNTAEAAETFALPLPHYVELEDVLVIGGSSMVLAGAHDVLYDYLEPVGVRQAEFKGGNLLHLSGENVSIKYTYSPLQVEEAFSLLHDHAHNYHHWMVEVLPRYLLARRHGLALDVPLLIGEQIGRLQEDVLRHVAGPKVRLIKVSRNQSVAVGKLHWVSDLSVNAVHTLHLPEKSDILISPTAIELLREMAAPFFVSNVQEFEKLQIIRHSVEFRSVVNRTLCSAMLTNNGFNGFDPGTATFEEQVRLFSNARLIVGEAGAALANMVFCQPGATLVVLVNGYKNSNYYYLVEMAESLGIHLVFFECFRLAGSHKLGVHDDMIVHVSELEAALRTIEAQALPATSAAAVLKRARLKQKKAETSVTEPVD